MAKNNPQSQAAFSFFDEVEKLEPQPKARKHVLRPPAQIEMEEEKSQPPIAEQAPVDAAEAVAEALVDAGAQAEEIAPEPVAIEEAAEPEEALQSKAEPVPEQTDSEANDAGAPEVVKADRAAEKRNQRGRKSVKENAMAADLIEMPEDEVLFSRQYYSMGDVTTMFKENHSLIRYWESEFDILKPKKNGKGDRFFRPVDVKNLYLIYDLLRRRKFTIEGAREYLKNNKKAEEKFAAVQSLQKIKSFFLELKANL
ncbi:MerR family transcriptional regulator [Niabella insulamsoli]|uniref:MerR family transcriptional regulator n=1 Tax=Niabella insulamsoli TaxID=3144874 RepID=UPI0031FDFE32